MGTDARSRLLDYLALVAPGTPLRDGLERVLRGRTGALVVLGQSPEVQRLSTGG
ncbi:MAG: DNA integrity scanning protein DisA, partial [Actinomycetes bacterium]